MFLNSATILDIPFSGGCQEEVLNKILDFEADSKQKKSLIIFTPNPEFLVEAQNNPNFKEILQKGDINLPDGVGLVLAAKILGIQIGQRFSGADLVEKLLSKGNEKKWTVGIVAARRGVVHESRRLVEILQAKYPNIKFVNLDDQKFQIFPLTDGIPPKAVTNFKFQIILACQGMVKQEKWIMENKDRIKARVFVGIGGSLDFLSGFAKRAPRIMRVIGLEWLWRGLQRPKHFKRIWKAVFVFGWLVIKEKLNYKL